MESVRLFLFIFFFTIYYFMRQSFYGVRKYVTSPNKLHGRQMICFWMTFCIIYSVKCCISFNNSYCLELMYICDDYDRFVFVFSQQYSKKKEAVYSFLHCHHFWSMHCTVQRIQTIWRIYGTHSLR